MKTVVYVDTLFAINFIMDGLCLLLSAVWLSKKVRWLRLTAASVFGGLYSVALIALPFLHPLAAILFHFAAAVIICLIAVKWEGTGSLLRQALCFFFACAVMGGIMCAVFALCGSFVSYSGAFYGEPTATAVIICGVIAGSILIYCLGRLRAKSKTAYCYLKIKYRGKDCTLSCITDSGNLLICPFTALPVAVISKHGAEQLFDKEELEALLLTPVMEGIRPLPVKGVAGSVLLPSFVPDKTEIRIFGEKSFEEKRLCIALQLSDEEFDNQDGIVPAAVL